MKVISEQLSKARIETFSDAIFAIVITLLVLELRIGELEDGQSVVAMAHALQQLIPKLLGLVISFITICVIWINHHRLFHRAARGPQPSQLIQLPLPKTGPRVLLFSWGIRPHPP